ncbi:MAG: type II secretion system protein [Polyangiaceae bacterium]|nr:type II secretion system protein [Polyangiaceae bacterium]
MRRARAFTLIELLVVVALAGLLTTVVVLGAGSTTNARLKASTTLISSAVRTAYTRASAVSKPHRVVMDFQSNRVWIEEGTGQMLVQSGDVLKTGGAEAATAPEKAAAMEAERVLKGPRAPKAAFRAIKGAMVTEDESTAGRELGRGIRFREVMVAHQAEPVREGRAYLYAWPGGTTELAYIQVGKGESPTSDESMTLTVHPLTGKVKVVPGAKTIKVDDQASEREERSF